MAPATYAALMRMTPAELEAEQFLVEKLEADGEEPEGPTSDYILQVRKAKEDILEAHAIVVDAETCEASGMRVALSTILGALGEADEVGARKAPEVKALRDRMRAIEQLAEAAYE